MQNVENAISYVQENSSSFIIPLLILTYILYYKKYRFYRYVQSEHGHGDPKIPRGACPPFFPNGWYRLEVSVNLRPGDVRAIDCVGRNVVLFRGTDGKPYVLDAYCAHMGANLGIGGKVKFGNCIECPFHGWIFEGSSGKAVLDDEKTARKADFYDYNNGVSDPKQCENGSFLKKCGEGEPQINKYEVREINGFIMVWFHCREEFRHKPLWEPLIYEVDLPRRGESVQYVNCHVQEMPENGADIRHFDYVHLEPVTGSINFTRFRWAMKTMPASDPNLLQYMKHEKKFVNDFKMKRLKKYLTEENKPYSNVISLDCWLVFFGKWEIFFFNATGIQIGPSQVILFLASPFFEITFLQHVIPLDKFFQKVFHNIWASWYLPYWATALVLRLEVQQVLNDTTIWNKKTFGSKLSYNMKSEADRFLMNWRNWYAQFYDGGKEFQERLEKMDCPPPSPKSRNFAFEITQEPSDVSFNTFTNEEYRSFVTEFKSTEYYNEFNPNPIEKNSFQSFEPCDFDHMTAHPYVDFHESTPDSKSVHLIEESQRFVYENKRIYKRPKVLADDKGIRICFCIRKKEGKGNITALRSNKKEDKEILEKNEGNGNIAVLRSNKKEDKEILEKNDKKKREDIGTCRLI